MHPITLTAGQCADLFLLICTLEVESSDVGAAWNLVFADAHDVLIVRHLFPNGLICGEVVAALIDIGHINRRADVDRARIRCLNAREHFEKCRFTRAVAANNADYGSSRNNGTEIFDQHAIIKTFAQAVNFYDLFA